MKIFGSDRGSACPNSLLINLSKVRSFYFWIFCSWDLTKYDSSPACHDEVLPVLDHGDALPHVLYHGDALPHVLDHGDELPHILDCGETRRFWNESLLFIPQYLRQFLIKSNNQDQVRNQLILRISKLSLVVRFDKVLKKILRDKEKASISKSSSLIWLRVYVIDHGEPQHPHYDHQDQ